jgi:hypothetical protein
LLAAAQDSQSEAAHREEVAKMSETIEQTWEQELIARGEARGQLQEARHMLRLALDRRFGTLPDALLREIEALDDLERLHGAFERALGVNTLAEFNL